MIYSDYRHKDSFQYPYKLEFKKNSLIDLIMIIKLAK